MRRLRVVFAAAAAALAVSTLLISVHREAQARQLATSIANLCALIPPYLEAQAYTLGRWPVGSTADVPADTITNLLYFTEMVKADKAWCDTQNKETATDQLYATMGWHFGNASSYLVLYQRAVLPNLPVTATPSLPTPAPPSETPSATTVEFVAVQGAPPGGTATVTVRTAPAAFCTIRYTTPVGNLAAAQGLGPKTADGSGIAGWSWTIGPSTQAGTGTVTVTCNGVSATTGITIG